MTYPVWPASLMTAVRIRWQTSLRPMVRRSTMSNGRAKVQKIRSAAIYDYTASILVRTLSEFQDLQTFFAESCGGGAVPFEWKKPYDGTTAYFRWTSEPKISNIHQGGLYEVSFTLEDWP